MRIGRLEFCRRSAGSTRQTRKPAMFHREVIGDIVGDDGLPMMEGAMEEQVASSSDDVVGENLRNTSDELTRRL